MRERTSQRAKRMNRRMNECMRERCTMSQMPIATGITAHDYRDCTQNKEDVQDNHDVCETCFLHAKDSSKVFAMQHESNDLWNAWTPWLDGVQPCSASMSELVTHNHSYLLSVAAHTPALAPVTCMTDHAFIHPPMCLSVFSSTQAQSWIPCSATMLLKT